MTLRGAFVAAACTALVATPVSAQTQADAVRVTFAKGRVTVVAVDATLGDILREWARAGGSRFTNIEKIPVRERVTIRLENETELHALDVLLRPLAGYAVVARPQGAAGLSAIDRVLIMPGLSRPMVYGQAAPSPANAFANESQQPRQPFGGLPAPDDDGPVRREVPPPPMSNAGAPAPGLPAPTGQSSPLQGGHTQTVPGLGIVTSSQPGVVIPPQNQNPNQNTARPGARPGITPTPRPGGGGG